MLWRIFTSSSARGASLKSDAHSCCDQRGTPVAEEFEKSLSSCLTRIRRPPAWLCVSNPSYPADMEPPDRMKWRNPSYSSLMYSGMASEDCAERVGCTSKLAATFYGIPKRMRILEISCLQVVDLHHNTVLYMWIDSMTGSKFDGLQRAFVPIGA